MWQRDFAGTYEDLKKEWSDGLRPIMDAVLGTVSLSEIHNDVAILMLYL